MGSYAEQLANFVTSHLLVEINNPPETEINRWVTTQFIKHCESKDQILAKHEIVFSGYSGIIVAKSALKPVQDVTLDVQRSLFGTVQILPNSVLKRDFNLMFSALGVEWMGIKPEYGDKWLTECTGIHLDKIPTLDSISSSVVNSDNDEIVKAAKSRKSGIFCLGAGKFRDPQNIIKFNVTFDGISVVE